MVGALDMDLGVRSFVLLGVFKDVGFFRLVVYMWVLLVERIVLCDRGLVRLIKIEKLRLFRRLTVRQFVKEVPDQVCEVGVYRLKYSIHNMRFERSRLLVISVTRVRSAIMYIGNCEEILTVLFVP